MLWLQSANISVMKFAETVPLSVDKFKSNLREIDQTVYFQLQCILPLCHVQTGTKSVIATGNERQ